MNYENLNFDNVFVELLHWQQDQRGDYQKQLNTISPSQIGLCMRKVYFDEIKIDTSLPDKALKIFYNGNLIHDEFGYKVLDKYFKEVKRVKNAYIINEYPLKYIIKHNNVNLEVRGFIDDLLIVYDGQQDLKIPIELKSISNAFFKLKEPKPEHIMQVMLYLHFTKSKFGYIWYIHKDTLDSKTFKIEYDEEIYNMIVQRAKTFYDYKIKGSIPPAEANVFKNKDQFKNKCNYCKYIELCRQLGDNEVINK